MHPVKFSLVLNFVFGIVFGRVCTPCEIDCGTCFRNCIIIWQGTVGIVLEGFGVVLGELTSSVGNRYEYDVDLLTVGKKFWEKKSR